MGARCCWCCWCCWARWACWAGAGLAGLVLLGSVLLVLLVRCGAHGAAILPVRKSAPGRPLHWQIRRALQISKYPKGVRSMGTYL